MHEHDADNKAPGEVAAAPESEEAPAASLTDLLPLALKRIETLEQMLTTPHGIDELVAKIEQRLEQRMALRFRSLGAFRP